MSLKEQLEEIGACPEAIIWTSQFTNLQKAWDQCKRGDWMLWLLGRCENSLPWTEERKPLLSCAIDCTETIKHLQSGSHMESTIDKAVEVLRMWISGKATKDQAKAAHGKLYIAYASAHTTHSAAAAYAASDAVSAAYPVSIVAVAHYTAAACCAARTTPASITPVDPDTTQIKLRKQTAYIVRKHFPIVPTISKSS